MKAFYTVSGGNMGCAGRPPDENREGSYAGNGNRTHTVL